MKNILTHTSLAVVAVFLSVGELVANYEDDDSIESFIEHEVTRIEALKAARHLDLNKLRNSAGCNVCTSEEFEYCTSDKVIKDHCCCDGRYQEPFTYAEHRCFITFPVCRTYLDNCAEYFRVMTCCCHDIVGSKWRALAGASLPQSSRYLGIITLALLAILGHNVI